MYNRFVMPCSCQGGGGQRKYDGVDFTIVLSERRRWHIYITKNKNIGEQSGA